MKILQKKKIASIFAIVLMLAIVCAIAFQPTQATTSYMNNYKDMVYVSLSPKRLFSTTNLWFGY